MPTGQQYASTAPQTNLVGGINNSQTNAITVTSFTGYPSTPFTLTFDIGTTTEEAIDVLNVSGNTITNCTRGVDGTSAQNHSNNATVTHTMIARDLREARAHIDASSSNDSTGHAVHGLTSGSSVVGTTDTQTLTNKTLTSPTITGMSTANPNITGTVTGGAQYQNVTVGTTSVSLVPLTVAAPASQTAHIFDITSNAVNVMRMLADGTVLISPSGGANQALRVNAPSATISDVFDAQINSVTQVSVDKNGQLNVLVAPISVSGITGAATASRWVGGTAGGPPSTGTFSTGDKVVDTKYGGLWINTAGGSPGTWAGSGEMLIATTTLGSPAASVTFSSIPQSFTHLHVLAMSRSAGSGGGFTNLRLQFNGDTGANYGGRYILIQNSATVGGVANNSQTSGDAGFVTNTSAGGATMGGQSDIEVSNYSNANWLKQFTWNSNAGGSAIAWSSGAGGGTWNSAAAITSLTLLLADGSNFTANSVFQLYGRP